MLGGGGRLQSRVWWYLVDPADLAGEVDPVYLVDPVDLAEEVDPAYLVDPADTTRLVDTVGLAALGPNDNCDF